MKLWHSCLIDPTHDTSFTLRRACHLPTSPIIVPATKKWLMILVTYETSFTMSRPTGLTLQRHQRIRLPRKINSKKWEKFAYDRTMSRTWAFQISPHSAPAAQNVTSDLHQIVQLPPKMALMIGPRQIRNVIYIAQSNRTHPPTWPNTSPATKKDSHDWSLWHMKRHLQCAEQQHSPFNVTKYCACHKKWHSKIVQNMRGIWKNGWNVRNVIYSKPGSDHEPSMIREWTRQSAIRRATEVTFHADNFVWKTAFRAPTIIPNFTK